MTDISFTIDADTAEQVGKLAAEAGQTGSSYIASRLPEWLLGDQLVNELEDAPTSLRQTLAKATSQ